MSPIKRYAKVIFFTSTTLVYNDFSMQEFGWVD